MPKKPTKRGKEIRWFILRSTEDHPSDLVRYVSDHFDISRQAILRYVQELVADGSLNATGTTKQRWYALAPPGKKSVTFELDGLEEDAAWRSEIRALLPDLPENVMSIWNYGFTEMTNNAIDHSGGTELVVHIERTSISTKMIILDNGVGIFKKITAQCGLEDERHAVLELAKGKLTTDPERHTGEGIFFTSRMFDDFAIISGDICFSHEHGAEEDWVLNGGMPRHGTGVVMALDNASSRTDQEVFNQFASEEEDYGFTKTVVPVRMAQQPPDKLISRSQAKRLLARVDRFSTVIFDFSDVESAGRAFLDEIFRVFERGHPNILILAINTNRELEKMIAATRGNGSSGH